MARLNWKGTQLVVISACDSGKGDIQAGEGVYGLKRAIAVAVARFSLLSLWAVDDLATAAFMESFYIKLKAGAGRAVTPLGVIPMCGQLFSSRGIGEP